jgi:cell division protein FtsL
MELGYELGEKHAHVARLREVKRVLELELSSHETPERVELVARSLLGMTEPSPDRIFAAGKLPSIAEEQAGAGMDAGAASEPNALDEDAP